MTEPTSYHHGDLENAVRHAALDIIAQQGPAAFTLREVARRAGVSHTAPKHHFGDKRQLLTRLATEGFELLLAAMDEAAEGASDPHRAVVDQVAAYVRLRIEHPGYTAIMWRNDLVDPDDTALATAARATFRRLYETAVELDDNACPGLTRYQLALLIWSLAHGVTQLADRLTPALGQAVGVEDTRLPGSPDRLAREFVSAVLSVS